MNPKIKELIYESNGFYQDCCDSETICFDPKDLEKFVELIIREGEEVIDFISTQHLLEHFGFLDFDKREEALRLTY
jgi:hypothetical protein